MLEGGEGLAVCTLNPDQISFGAGQGGYGIVPGLGNRLHLVLQLHDAPFPRFDFDVEVLHRADLFVEPAELGIAGRRQSGQASLEVGDLCVANHEAGNASIGFPGRPFELGGPSGLTSHLRGGRGDTAVGLFAHFLEGLTHPIGLATGRRQLCAETRLRTLVDAEAKRELGDLMTQTRCLLIGFGRGDGGKGGLEFSNASGRRSQLAFEEKVVGARTEIFSHLEPVAEVALGGSMFGNRIPRRGQLSFESPDAVVIERFRQSCPLRSSAFGLEARELLLCGLELGAECGDLGVGVGKGVAYVIGTGLEEHCFSF